jgi:large subunit ribosomal protein L53
MITRYLTEVVARFNPFLPSARAARIFLTSIPAEARLQMRVSSTVLPRSSGEKPVLDLKFSTSSLPARLHIRARERERESC